MVFRRASLQASIEWSLCIVPREIRRCSRAGELVIVCESLSATGTITVPSMRVPLASISHDAGSRISAATSEIVYTPFKALSLHVAQLG